MAGTRESHPISDSDLDKYKGQAEEVLKKVKGNQDIEDILRSLSPEEQFRTLPEELKITYALRMATCLYFYFFELLKERTGLQKEVEESRLRGATITPSIKNKARFVSSYAFFVMASWVTTQCEKELKSKDKSKLAQLDTANFELVLGNGPAKDLGYALSYYVDALTMPGNEGKLINNVGDTLSVSRDYWKALANKAGIATKESPPELLALVNNTTFKHGNFAITGLVSSDKEELKIMTWAPVMPEDVIGDSDVTVLMLRWCDMLAHYDPIIQKNPFVEFGGLIESGLIDGLPGTGKTSRMRMMMTRVAKRAEQVGLPYVFKSLTADQVKNEFYGTTAKLLAEFLKSVLDPSVIALLFVDDIDLIVTPDRGSAQGADNDVMKGLMDFFSGTGSNYTGSYMAWAATNKPTASDGALRQRFIYRAPIRGPQTWEDYADLVYQELRSFSKNDLLQVGDKGYKPKTRVLANKLGSDAYSSELASKYKGKKSANWEDIGQLCAELLKRDASFTGRSVKNAIQVAKAKAANFDVPEEWFTDPLKFRARGWDERVAMVKALYKTMAADQVMIALEHQFEVEQRYKVEAHEKEISGLTERINVEIEARKRVND
ncbi:MAG: AAA family ATPase [bacterium]|nr:AAA family ATPase [bacterium]